MITEEKLNKLYNGVVEERELTTKQLNEYGFNSNDLSELINQNVLERIKRGYYKFLSIEKLYRYGIKLISNKEFEEANKCFEKCYKLDPSHTGVAFQLFIKTIRNEDYQAAFEYFDKIYNKDYVKFNKNDTNFYLYMLNMITDIPNKYKEIVKKIRFDDIKVGKKEEKNSEEEYINNIRSLALKRKFAIALQKTKNLINQNYRISAQDIITKMLLSQAITAQLKLKQDVLFFVKNKQYNELTNYLENIQNKYKLNYADSSVLLLARDLKKIINYGVIPQKINYPTDKLFELISCRNYDLALKMSNNYLQENNFEAKDNAIYLLLEEINKYINEDKNITKKEEINNSVKLEDKSSDSTISFSKVTQSLLNQDLDKAFVILKKYLENINKSEYEFLIINLIKISVLEGDVTFSKPMIALSNISRENYVFVISEYIQNFYESLSNNKFSNARLYLDILSKSNKIVQQSILTDSLKELLNNTEKNYLQNNEAKESMKEVNKLEKTTSNNTQPIKKVQEEKNQKSNPYNKNIIIEKMDDLRKKGIILLKPMDLVKRNKIHEAVKKIPGVVSFDIEYEGRKQVVLKYQPLQKEQINIVKIVKEGKAAYITGDYNLCLDKYKQILETDNPAAIVYSKIGLSYMKKWNTKLAINYLKISTYLLEQEKRNFDFVELIDSLRGTAVSENKKVNVNMKEEEFYNDLDDYYGIECIDEISDLLHSGVSLDEACTKLNLSEHQKQLILLISAKECYAIENYSLGDKYIKRVEKSENKDKMINTLMYKLKKNKRFYKNRATAEEKKKLVLIPSNKSTK